MPGIDFLQNSGFDFQMLIFYANVIPVFIPLISMSFAFIVALRLFMHLEPGMVCELEDTCFRCHLLYGMSLGTIIFSFIFIVREFFSYAMYADLLMHKHSLECLTNLMTKTGIFVFLSWLCLKGKECLMSNCLHKSKLEKKHTDLSFGFASIVSGGTCSCMCYPSKDENIEFKSGYDHVKENKRRISRKKQFVHAAALNSRERRCPSYLSTSGSNEKIH